MLKKSITKFVEQQNLLPDKAKIVLGLSGGPDSVFLLDFLAPLHKAGQISLTAAHLDHQWRENSLLDAQFCAELAAQYNIPFITQKISDLTLSKKPTGSLEALGRAYRRAFLTTTCKQTHSTIIALGHHVDDQQETFFIRLIRGATLSGLACMRPKVSIKLYGQTGYIIRPLLEIKKMQILDYLHAKNIAYLVDSTNTNQDFLRNKLRLTVLPALEQADSRFTQNFSNALESLQATESYLEDLTQKTFYSLTRYDSITAIYSMQLPQLLSLDTYLRNRVIIYWLCKAHVPFIPSKALISEIVRFLENHKSARHILYNKWQLTKKGSYATIYI